MGIVTNRRRVMGGKPLPYDSVVEYLESTGTQWIDTMYVPQSTTSIDILVKIISAPNAFSPLAYCGDLYYSRNTFGAAFNKNATRLNLYYGTKYNVYCGVVNVGDEVQFMMNINNATLINITTSNTYNVSIGGTYQIGSRTLYLLNGNTNTADLKKPSSMQIKSAVLKENNTLVRDFIPVRVGQVGYMYDRVSRQLFGNAGTGAFIVGPDVNN